MPYTRRALLGALSGVAGLSTVRLAHAGGPVADPLGVRADFPVADTSLFLNSAYITPTPVPVVDAGREFAASKGYAPIALGDMRCALVIARAIVAPTSAPKATHT